MANTFKKITIILISFVVIAGFISSCAFLGIGTDEPQLTVLFINVGDADCALIKYDDKAYLIDTGSFDSLPSVIRTLKAMEVESLTGVFLTHTHKDHIGGLEGLINLIEIDTLYLSQITDFDKKGENEVIELANQYDKSLVRLIAGTEILLDEDINNAKFTVLAPYVHNTNDENDNSLVMRLDYYDNSILFAADMQFEEEQTLLVKNLLEPCDILKVANHGNDDATSLEFANAISPSVAIISTDKDILSEQNQSNAVGNLYSVGANLYATFQAQMGIEIDLTGQEYQINFKDYNEINAAKDIRISHIDRDAEYLELDNRTGEDVDLTGWWLVSTKGNEIYFFPDGFVLPAGQKIIIASDEYSGFYDLYWNDNNNWRNNKDDMSLLYDNNGTFVDSFSLPEK